MRQNQEEKTYEEHKKEKRKPLYFELYKGLKGNNGAIRLDFKRPYEMYLSDKAREEGKKEKYPGTVSLSMAPAVGPNVYDWENSKVTMNLSVSDMAKIICFFKSPGKYVDEKENMPKISIFHDPGAGTDNKNNEKKYLNIYKKAEMNNFMVSLQYKNEREKKSVNITVPVSYEESMTICILLEHAIPASLSWTAFPYRAQEE